MGLRYTVPVRSFGIDRNLIEGENLRQKVSSGKTTRKHMRVSFIEKRPTLFHHYVHVYESAYTYFTIKNCSLSAAPLKVPPGATDCLPSLCPLYCNCV